MVTKEEIQKEAVDRYLGSEFNAAKISAFEAGASFVLRKMHKEVVELQTENKRLEVIVESYQSSLL